MGIHKNLKKFVIVSASALLVMSLGGGAINVSANSAPTDSADATNADVASEILDNEADKNDDASAQEVENTKLERAKKDPAQAKAYKELDDDVYIDHRAQINNDIKRKPSTNNTPKSTPTKPKKPSNAKVIVKPKRKKAPTKKNVNKPSKSDVKPVKHVKNHKKHVVSHKKHRTVSHKKRANSKRVNHFNRARRSKRTKRTRRVSFQRQINNIQRAVRRLNRRINRIESSLK